MSDNQASEGISFSKVIGNFGHSMEGLREFVLVVESYLTERQEKIIKTNAPHLTPILLAFRKLMPEKMPASNISDEEMAKRFKGDISIKVKDDGEGKKSAQIKIKGEGEQDFDRAMKELGQSHRSINLLYSNTLISLLSSVELFLSQLIHLYYRQFPDAIVSKDKVFAFEELKSFDSIEDARMFLIEARVENILRGSFDDWMTFFKTHPKLSMGYLELSFSQLTEACQRRNLVVHNGGVVNSIYLSKVPPDVAKKHKKGEQLLVSSEYLKEQLDLFELNGLLIAFEMWKKLNAADVKRGEALGNASFSHLCAKRWSICEGLGRFLMNDKGLPENNILVGKLNYWLSVKRQNRWSEVKKEAEAEDMSAKGQRYQLGWLALCERKDDFFALLPKVIKSKQLTREELRDFPIFDEMRSDSRIKKYLPLDRARKSATRSQFKGSPAPEKND